MAREAARNRRRWALAALAGAWVSPGLARLHEVGLSNGDYRLVEDRVEVRIALSPSELVAAVPDTDPDRSGDIDPGELPRVLGTVKNALQGRMQVSAGGAPCAREDGAVSVDPQDGVVSQVAWRCPSAGQPRVEVGFLSGLPAGHRHLARVTSGQSRWNFVLHASSASFTAPATLAGPTGSARSGSNADVLDGFHAATTGPAGLLVGVLTLLGRTPRAGLGAAGRAVLAMGLAAAGCLLLGLAPAAGIAVVLAWGSVSFAVADGLLSRANRGWEAMAWLLAWPPGMVLALAAPEPARVPWFLGVVLGTAIAAGAGSGFGWLLRRLATAGGASGPRASAPSETSSGRGKARVRAV